jgi:hypothetical protein
VGVIGDNVFIFSVTFRLGTFSTYVFLHVTILGSVIMVLWDFGSVTVLGSVLVVLWSIRSISIIIIPFFIPTVIDIIEKYHQHNVSARGRDSTSTRTISKEHSRSRDSTSTLSRELFRRNGGATKNASKEYRGGPNIGSGG